MKIIDPSFMFIQAPTRGEAYRIIASAMRNCYRAELNAMPKTDTEMVEKAMKLNHLSLIEHVVVTVNITCDRGVTHELVRHRLASYCLSGEAEVVAFRKEDSSASSQKKWTIKQLFDWTSDPKRKGRIGLIRLRSVDKSGRIVPGKIGSVVFSGKQETFTVKFKSGREIRSTEQHRFMTKDGWMQLKNLKTGDRVYANGVEALENKEWLERVYIEENNTLKEVAALAQTCVTYVTRALRKHGINKPLSMRKNRVGGRGIPGMHSEEGRQKISKRMDGYKNHRWKGGDVLPNTGRLRAKKMFSPDICWGCGTEERLERHHMDKNPINNEGENILFLCKKCHKSFHLGAGVLTVFLDEIASIEKYGIEDTYDISMESAPHNFVANGIVVHNSQESTRYCNYSGEKFGRELTFIRPAGKSEQILGSHTIEWKDLIGTRVEGQINPELDTGTNVFFWHLAVAERDYMWLLDAGWTPQEARAVLPNSLASTIAMTANLREWIHVFRMRCDLPAHPDMRQIMIPIMKSMLDLYPVVFQPVHNWLANKGALK